MSNNKTNDEMLVDRYLKAEKDEQERIKNEFISLLEEMVINMRTNPEKFQKDTDKSRMIIEYQELYSELQQQSLSKEEKEHIQSLFDTLKRLLQNYNEKNEKEKQMTKQELLLYYLNEINSQWEKIPIYDKKNMIEKINKLQMDRQVINKMTQEQQMEYQRLMSILKEKYTVEAVSQEEYEEITTKFH